MYVAGMLTPFIIWVGKIQIDPSNILKTNLQPLITQSLRVDVICQQMAYGTTGKTLTDHALDSVTGRDCNMIHVFNKYRKVCRERMPDLSTPEKIRAFQKSKGLEQTGRIGPLTRIAVWRIKNELD